MKVEGLFIHIIHSLFFRQAGRREAGRRQAGGASQSQFGTLLFGIQLTSDILAVNDNDYMYVNLDHYNCSGLRIGTLHKQLKIQRRLAWSLCKNDTRNRRE